MLPTYYVTYILCYLHTILPTYYVTYGITYYSTKSEAVLMLGILNPYVVQ